MDQPRHHRHDFSHNHFSVSGGEARVQYGNIYQSKSISVFVPSSILTYRDPVPERSEISWREIRKWIVATETAPLQRTFQRSMQRRRMESITGLWFLEGEAFGQWIKAPRSFLWLHGKSL